MEAGNTHQSRLGNQTPAEARRVLEQFEGFAPDALEHGDANLYFRDLSVEVPCHEALTHEFDVMHLSLEAASAVVSAQPPPDRAPEVSRGIDRLVSDDGTCRSWASTAWRSCAAEEQHGHCGRQSHRGICGCRSPHLQ